MGMGGRMHACSRCCFLLAALCVVSLKLLRHPKGADSFRPLFGLDHPVSSIPAATPPRGPPKLPRCTAQPAQLRRRIIDWQLFILCVSLSLPAVLPCPACFDGGPGRRPTPIKPSRFSPITAGARPRKETTLPSAQFLGLDRDACHTFFLSSPTLYSQIAVCARRSAHAHMQNAYDTLEGTGGLGERGA